LSATGKAQKGRKIFVVLLMEAGNIWLDVITTGRISIKDGKFGNVSQLNLRKCTNKQLCLVIDGHKS